MFKRTLFVFIDILFKVLEFDHLLQKDTLIFFFCKFTIDLF